MKHEYLYWNCEKLLQAYKTKQLSPVEVVKETLNNAKKYNKSFNCWSSNAINLVSGRSLKNQLEVSKSEKSDKHNLYERNIDNSRSGLSTYQKHLYPL